MKKLFSLFVAFTLSVVIFGELNVMRPESAAAGVLSRSSSNGLGIRAPRSRDRHVRSTTQVMRATAPRLEYNGVTFEKIHARMAKSEKKYRQRYIRWQKKKFRIEQKAYKQKEKQARLEERRLEKKRKAQLRNVRVQRTGAASSDAHVATSPTEWFTKKIARTTEGGSLSVTPEQAKLAKKGEGSDTKGQELNVAPKRKGGFWSHIKRALFGG